METRADAVGDHGVQGFDQNVLSQLQEVFDFLDKDRSGAIGYLMELLKLDGSEDALREIIAEVDANRDGHVSFEEFVIGGTHSIGYKNEDVQRAFRIFTGDRAPKGCISKSNLKTALLEYGDKKELEDVDLDRLISQFSHSLEEWVDYAQRVDVYLPK